MGAWLCVRVFGYGKGVKGSVKMIRRIRYRLYPKDLVDGWAHV
jgi:hypothetical protein